MVEVLVGVVHHAEARHDRLRACVARRRVGDDLVQPAAVEAVSQRRSRRLGGVAVPPVVGVEAPSHLDRRRAGQPGAHPVQADHRR